MEQAARAPLSGERIGNYELLEVAGSGGMGIVYKAHDLKLDRIVALKFLPQGLTLNPTDKERFLGEARAASRLDHPNIGVIHGLEEAPDGRMFIVMGFYEGETIERKLHDGPLSPGQAANIAAQIARGLSEAHAHHIVHRDIKPSNVIVTHQGVAKIVDFGLARALTTSSATHSMFLAGTAAYLSPEQAMGTSFDHRADIWALGITFAEMLTGKHPFHRDNISAVIFALVHDSPEGIETIPADLQPIIYHTLSKDPDHRYQSCKELLHDLEPITAKLTAQTQSFSPTESKRRSKVLTLYAQRASGTALRPAKPPSRKWAIVLALVLLALVAPLGLRSVRERLGALLLPQSEKHIAVLPFDNVGSNPANQALIEGLMDSLTSRLSNLEVGQQSLWVVPASVVRRRNVDDPTAALHTLGATYVVQGSVRGDGNQLRLTLNLIATKNLRQVGSFELEDPNGDMSTMQDEAVSRLAKLMDIAVTPEMLAGAGTSANPKAYESYLKALGLMQRYDKPRNLDQAIAALESATKQDQQFALGFAQIAEAYRLKNKVSPDPSAIDKALTYAKRSLELSDKLPVAYITLGRLHDDTGKHELAIQEFERALQMNPRSADAINGLGHAYESAGRIPDAEKTFQRAAAMRTDYWDGYNTLALFYDRQRRYDESIAQLKNAIDLTPDNAYLWLNLGAVYLDTGDPKRIPDAETAIKKSIELSPSYAGYANLGFMFIRQKRYAESAHMSEKALELNSNDSTVWENAALAYQRLGKMDKYAAAKDREIELVSAALKTNPDDAQMQAILGLLYAQRKQREKALPLLRAALARTPDDASVLANVGEAYETLGDRRTAIKYIREAITKGYQLADLQLSPGLESLLADPVLRPILK
jgi:eukaryotic-like serine/threonine-protein kinase